MIIVNVLVANAAINWGSVPDWIGGLGTAAATILLAVGWLRESKLRQQDLERQAVLAARQLVLDIEGLYETDRQNGSMALTTAGTARQERLLRELQTHTAVVRENRLREPLYQATTFIGEDGAIGAFQGDSPWLVARNCCRYALDAIAAYMGGKPYPGKPSFLSEYQAALDEYGAMLQQHYEDELSERMGRARRREPPAADGGRGEEDPSGIAR